MTPQIIGGVLYGADNLVARWVEEKCDGSKPDVPVVGLGIAGPDDSLVGGILFFNRQGSDIQCCVAGSPRGVKLRAMARCFTYPFIQLGLRRVTAEIEMKNERSIRLAQGLGFVREGVKRKAAADGGHVGVFGLLEKDFRLKRYMP